MSVFYEVIKDPGISPPLLLRKCRSSITHYYQLSCYSFYLIYTCRSGQSVWNASRDGCTSCSICFSSHHYQQWFGVWYPSFYSLFLFVRLSFVLFYCSLFVCSLIQSQIWWLDRSQYSPARIAIRPFPPPKHRRTLNNIICSTKTLLLGMSSSLVSFYPNFLPRSHSSSLRLISSPCRDIHLFPQERNIDCSNSEREC